MNEESVKIVIVGAGPRGLTVLERVIAFEKEERSVPLEIIMFDPNPPGVGCHSLDQPDHLLVNTVASQITMFSDETVKDAGPVLEGPSFYHWLRENKTISNLLGEGEERHVHPDRYYARRLFGEYLNWVFQYLTRLAPSHVSVRHITSSVCKITKADKQTWSVIDSQGRKFNADYLFLTTGHTERQINLEEKTKYRASNNEKEDVITDPYPIRDKLINIGSDLTVAIEGLGLTTFDILSELTIGRGGKFQRSDSGVGYQPSGREPKILAYSRSGLPLTARAANQKGVTGQYKPRFLTLDQVKKLRKQGKLDFQSDILPLLLKDMEYAYYEAYFRTKYGQIAATLFCNQYVFSSEKDRLLLIERKISKEDRFNWEKLKNPIPNEALASKQASF
jgi:uncharacterized NAD(P)/FAD-binding protein YdhS